MRLPKFKSEKEEAEFWDGLDTTQILEEVEKGELEYEPEPLGDICIQCGGKIVERKRDYANSI
jgi:hypothetical protein